MVIPTLAVGRGSCAKTRSFEMSFPYVSQKSIACQDKTRRHTRFTLLSQGTRRG